jgi:hypothetical protein
MYMSFLYRKSMIQKEWMTSREVSLILTFLSTGRTGSAVAGDVALGVGLGLDAHRPHGVVAGLAVGLVVVVLEVPGPLLADRRDADVGVVVLRLDDRLVARREGEEAEHEDQRDDRVEDLDGML